MFEAPKRASPTDWRVFRRQTRELFAAGCERRTMKAISRSRLRSEEASSQDRATTSTRPRPGMLWGPSRTGTLSLVTPYIPPLRRLPPIFLGGKASLSSGKRKPPNPKPLQLAWHTPVAIDAPLPSVAMAPQDYEENLRLFRCAAPLDQCGFLSPPESRSGFMWCQVW